jgi:hypothetical protein
MSAVGTMLECPSQVLTTHVHHEAERAEWAEAGLASFMYACGG